ncbi:MAG: 23S rRNA (adenine(2503)-C(2))-methyltransferase RlmN [Treponema sp.]|nr:23S rRNA (adenine(2503)-C(2))-methyltransferase RlmN [Treponema sp.]
MDEKKPVLSGLSLEELEELLAPLPPYRAAQIFRRLGGGALSFNAMTELSLSLRKELQERFSLFGSSVSGRIRGADGTVKLRIALEDGAAVEAVLLRDGKNRLTCCLSTQAGCPVGCVFCKTGSLGFLRNLSAAEIVEQFYYITQEGSVPLSNMVIMGMGEPLLNLDNLRKALSILCDARGRGFSKRRITLSTSGIYRGILDLARGGPKIELAFSLTCAREHIRQALMPGTRGSSLKEIKEALTVYQRSTGRRITLETVLLGGINTSGEDAGALLAFTAGLDAAVNVIPWNPVEGLRFDGKPLVEASEQEIDRFCARLRQGKITVTTRYRKGREICGACGQLGGVLPL